MSQGLTWIRRSVIAGVACGALAALGCVHEMSEARTAPGTSPSPAKPWIPPADLAVPPAPERKEGGGAPTIPPDLLQAAEHWTLLDLIDLALRNSPQTRVAWARARAAAADLGSRGGAYYPSIAGQVTATTSQGSVAAGKFTFKATSSSPLITLNWLLLDFGGRKATIESAREALISADWTHNATIQDTVLQVQQAYYQYLNARALEQSEETSVKEAEASLDAAETRRRAGLATIADVLQAKTVLSQARLGLETVQGLIQTIHGSLATAIGLPANVHFDVAIPSVDLPREQAAVEVERAIQEAEERRPDLAAARADVEKAKADVRAKAAADRPTLNLTSNGGLIGYDHANAQQNIYSASLLLTIPIFNGLTYQYNLLKAKSDQEVTLAQLDTLRQQVTFQVWSSYYNHKTAERKVGTAKDLLDSARQSFEVVTARYKAGVGSILDLLTAQSALESARAQETQARTDWFLTLAQLAHDTGTLWQPGPASAQPDPTEGTQ